MRIKTIIAATAGLGLFVLAMTGAWYLLAGRPPQYCQLSGRPIHPNMRTVVVVNGKRLYACCTRCALTEERQTGKRIAIVGVTDYLSGRGIEADKAYFVDGSQVEPCSVPAANREEGRTPYVRAFDRCSPSLIAFDKESDARAFVAQHGGTVTRLSDLERELETGSEPKEETPHD